MNSASFCIIVLNTFECRHDSLVVYYLYIVSFPKYFTFSLEHKPSPLCSLYDRFPFAPRQNTLFERAQTLIDRRFDSTTN